MDKNLNILLNGNNVLVERFEMPKQTESGLILPEAYANDKDGVGTVNRLDPWQKRGVITKIGMSCSEEFKKNFKEGDIVHFGFGGVEPIPIRKDVMVEDTPFILINEWSIHWKELEESVASS